jgi:hypothetical protein
MSTTSEQCWVPVFVDWVEGETDTLDFDGREVPERLQRLLTALEPPYHVLTLTAGGWNLQHPLECRPNLGDCRWNAEAAALEQALPRTPRGDEVWRYKLHSEGGKQKADPLP